MEAPAEIRQMGAPVEGLLRCSPQLTVRAPPASIEMIGLTSLGIVALCSSQIAAQRTWLVSEKAAKEEKQMQQHRLA